MKQLVQARGLLRPLIFASCALAAFARAPVQNADGVVAAWLTSDEFRARDGSLLPLFEDHYTDVGFLVDPVPLRKKSALAHSDYVDVRAAKVQRRPAKD